MSKCLSAEGQLYDSAGRPWSAPFPGVWVGRGASRSLAAGAFLWGGRSPWPGSPGLPGKADLWAGAGGPGRVVVSAGPVVT